MRHFFSNFETLWPAGWQKKSRHHTVTKQNSSSRKKRLTLCCVPGIGMMMTHCSTNSTGKATFKPLEAISDPHSRVYKVPLARTVLGNLQIFLHLFQFHQQRVLQSEIMTALINPCKFSAIITECTNLWEFSKIILRKVELWTIFKKMLTMCLSILEWSRKLKAAEGIEEGRTIVLLTIGART